MDQIDLIFGGSGKLNIWRNMHLTLNFVRWNFKIILIEYHHQIDILYIKIYSMKLTLNHF